MFIYNGLVQKYLPYVRQKNGIKKSTSIFQIKNVAQQQYPFSLYKSMRLFTRKDAQVYIANFSGTSSTMTSTVYPNSSLVLTKKLCFNLRWALPQSVLLTEQVLDASQHTPVLLPSRSHPCSLVSLASRRFNEWSLSYRRPLSTVRILYLRDLIGLY